MEKRVQLAQTQLVTTGTDVPGKIFNIGDLSENPTRVIVEHIFISNSTTTDLTFSLYHDKDGTTYNATTALFEYATVCSYKTTQIDVNIGMENKDENIAAKALVALGLTFSMYGVLEGV